MNSKVLAEKLFSFALAGALVLFLDWRSVILAMILLGQGHFAMAYLYQGLAGKVTRLYVLNYLFWAGLILTVYWAHPFPSGLTAVATIYFAVHMALDELYLTQIPLKLGESPMHMGRWLEMLPLIVTYAAAVSDAVLARGAWPQFPALLGPSLILSGLAYFAYFLLIWRGGYRPDWRSCYFLLAGASLDVAAKLGWLYLIPAPKLSGFIILFHYFCWYIHYYLSLPGFPARSVYLLRVGLVHLLVFGLYLGVGQTGPGWFFFQEQNFYIWVLLHLITSTRLDDLRGVMRWPG
ncbi:hypothetical protein JST97_26595 [bacterium]|nr:hypothetical protein [bacterium]